MAEYRAKICAAKLARKKALRAERIAERERKKAAAAAERLAKQPAARERRKQLQKVWREANSERVRELLRSWRQKNREKKNAANRARKTARRVTLVRDLTKLQRGKCAYCRVRLGDEYHVDHVMPLKRGGPDRRSNLQLTCVACNLSKNAKHPVDFARSIGRLI